MENKICPICKTEVAATANVCPTCGNAFLAPEQPVMQPVEQPVVQPVEQPAAAPMETCTACGAPLAPGQAFCSKCGTPKALAPQKNLCAQCGNELAPGQEFCPRCGHRAGVMATPEVNPAINQFNAAFQMQQPKKKSKLPWIIGGAVVAVIVLVLLISGGNSGSSGSGSGSSGSSTSRGPNLRAMYTQYCNSIWADVGSDGSYLSIDTNPYNYDDDGLAYPDAYYAIEKINNALGLPSSLLNAMAQTRSVDGRQTETYGDLTITWTYHPDKGLEVTYRVR